MLLYGLLKDLLVKAIGLYHCGGIDVDLATWKNVSNILFVDPYNSINPEWERCIAKKANTSRGRVIWGAIDLEPMVDVEDLVVKIMPYASNQDHNRLLDGVVRWVRDLNLSDDTIRRLVDNSRRTVHGEATSLEVRNKIQRIAAFWMSYLDWSGIEIFVSAIVPHSFVDLILAECCRYKGVPFICQVSVGMTRHVLHLNYTTGRYIESRYDSPQLDIDLRSLLNSCADPKSSFRTAYSPKINSVASSAMSRYKNRLLNGGMLQKKILRYKVELAYAYDRLAKSLEEVECEGKLNIIFLHYQPEMTTSPLAHDLFDQREIVYMVSKSLDKKDKLIVKEHPRQFIDCGLSDGSEEHILRCLQYRSSNYYQEVVSNRSCFLLKRMIKNEIIFGLTDLKVWSATGTVNLQAFLNGHEIGYLPTLSPFFMLAGASPRDYSMRYDFAYMKLRSYSYPMIRGEAIEDIYLSGVEFYKLINSAMEDR